MDIYDYLKLDHEHVTHLFELFENSDYSLHRKQIADLLIDELLLHAHAEQETFYKALLRDETFKLVQHSKKEHREIEEQIKRIQTTKKLDSEWVKKVKKLKEIVDHHVKEEEGSLFRQAKNILSDEDAYRLKELMHYLKMQLKLNKRKKAA
ncbi:MULTISPECIES: hemerythrin domain-containing protein [Legionella]|uniref:DNA nickase n=1 Tax=Legionella maceachernii TaxID=466 RepID=A0A0W0WCW0_9GAMM|nr:hemerythrin domain-containing protein [Legionella maceachernii]KTD30172.1 DNA nickase [Legionella maceachernii]SJZ92962.1 Hemerythrin HHE cation binding domain-containing protein [Legionella maceachernii]SUP03478.1 Alr3199 protein [Legionella maceachernii]